LAKAGERALQLQGELTTAKQKQFDIQHAADESQSKMKRDLQALMDAAATSAAEEEKLQQQLETAQTELANSTAKFVAKERLLNDQQGEVESLKKKLLDLSHQMEAYVTHTPPSHLIPSIISHEYDMI
jgi:predicted  nucleic acid-binding Zn-ribbon protein